MPSRAKLQQLLGPSPPPTVRATAVQVLDAVGIGPVCECVHAGFTFAAIAHYLGLDRASLRHWVEANPDRARRFSHARTDSVDTFYGRWEESLLQARDAAQLTRASAQAGHLRKWAAKRLPPSGS